LDIHASRFQPPASDSAPKTQDTSGHLSQPELLQCDQVSVLLKTSRDISALGFPTCCKTWREWVTERRGAWRQRVNAARLTRGRGSLSWPTATAFDFNNTPLNRIDGTGKTYKSNLKEAVHQNWPTVCASEVRQGFQDRSRGMKGSQESLTTAVVKDAANWSTPRAQEDQSSVEAFNKRADAILARRKPTGGRQKPGLTQEVQMYGQADPASSSSHGSRQGLWPTHTNTGTGRVYDGRRGRDLESYITNPQAWATPQAHDAQGPKTPEQIAVMRAKGHGVKNLNEMVSWATPCSRDHHPNGQADGSKTDLGNQVTAQWGTPTARDHKSGRGNEDRQYKELTPMVERAQTGKLNPRWVETLMGLPIGWTMPSCTSPQTIAPMSCDSSAMELSQPPQSEPSEFSLAS
jgi:hypothetical protein